MGYLVGAQDTNQLLEFQLQRLFSQAHELNVLRKAHAPAAVDTEDFENKAREVSVEDLTPFYESVNFRGEAGSQYGFRRTRDAQGRDVFVRASDLEAYKAA